MRRLIHSLVSGVAVTTLVLGFALTFSSTVAADFIVQVPLADPCPTDPVGGCGASAGLACMFGGAKTFCAVTANGIHCSCGGI
jgi:hypothetical protein